MLIFYQQRALVQHVQRIRCPNHIRVWFTAISTLYLISTSQNIPPKEVHGEKGLRHIMTCEVSRFQLYIPLPLVFVVIYVRILYLFIMLRLSPLTNV